MSEVGSAGGAQIFGALHQELAVGLVLDLVWRDRRVEAWPSRTAVVLGFARKQQVVTHDTVVFPLGLVVVEGVCERALSTGFLGDVVLLFGKPFFELCFGEFFACHAQANVASVSEISVVEHVS